MRRLLASLERPQELARSRLGNQLQEALGAASVRDAVLWLVNKTFEEPSRQNALLRDVICKSDLDGEKGSRVASALNVSTRTFFRLRADAIAMLAHAAEQVQKRPEPRTDFKYEISRMISPVKPQTAAHLLEREAERLGGRAAYEAVCASARNGHDVPSSLLDKCTGHWRPLAELEIARTNLNHGNPERYQTIRPAIVEALDRLSGPPRARVEFELAYVDRLDAIRRCDVNASAEATTRLLKASGADLRLRALACVCQAEQACDEGDLAAADALLEELQAMCLRLDDFRIYARTSHVSSIVKLLQGNYAEARDLCDVTVAALGQVEPEFAACAAAIAGRADLFWGCQWERPGELSRRFPQSYVTAFLDAVWARHLVTTNAKRALIVAQRAASLAAAQNARGALAYANGTLAIVYRFLDRSDDARRQAVVSWEQGVPLRRPFYLYDLLVHPALPQRAMGIFHLDEALRAMLGRRLMGLLSDALEKPTQPHWAMAAMTECLTAALDPRGERRSIRAPDRTHDAAQVLRRAPQPQRQLVTRCFNQLAVEAAYCLSPQHRSSFISRFTAAVSDLFDARPA
jgi:hypothetical protein